MLSIILRSVLGIGNDWHLDWFLGPLLALTAIFNIWNLLYFLELMPGFGMIALSIRRMQKVMLQFLLVFFLLFCSFEFTFFRLFNDRGLCHHGFDNFLDTFYNTFLIMVNMVDLVAVNGKIDFMLVLLHVTYVFLVAILLLNFLIALLSDVNSKMMKHECVLLRLQQLSAALLVEQRTGLILQKLVGQRISYYFRREDNKLYLVCQY